MALNTGKLAGKTLFITGASRGIGKAIAVKAAKDGANIVIAAKTAEPHPKLPGTIYTVAKEVEEAGGKCLPCIVDIRYEDQVNKAVEEAVKTFGGIDILVNNASAISLTGTLQTPMKKFDLMMGINGRGTYLCSRACIPYLKQAKNPHILALSPPLNMKPMWFKNHVAYTMAKYNMSMCVLGMAAELRDDGIAVNALWPRTAILTAAMEMLAGPNVKNQCRYPSIMADAAYAILSQSSRGETGQFYIDDEVLQKVGLTDISKYDCVPGSTLLPDFFLDSVDPDIIKKQIKNEATMKANGTESPEIMFNQIANFINEDLVKSVNGIFCFEFPEEDIGSWYLDLKTGSGAVFKGKKDGVESDCQMIMKPHDFVKMFKGELKPTMAFMSGKLKIKGNMALAMKLEKLMAQMHKSKL